MAEAYIIQRYMDLGKFERLLKDKALFLTKMSVFNDKLEGGLTAADYIRNSNDAYDLDIAINFSWPSFDETQEQRSRRGEEARAANTKVRAREFETPFGKYKSDNIQELFPLCRELIYVSCWHKSQYECSAMWQIYGSDNNSICIISTLDRLKNSIQKVDSLNSLLFAETDYIDHDDAKFSGDTLAPFKSKSLPYSFEKELRVIGFNSNINLNDVLLNDEKGINIPISSLSILIEKIIISPHSDSDFIGQVKELCVSFGLESKVEHSKLRRKPIDDFFSAMKGLEKGNV